MALLSKGYLTSSGTYPVIVIDDEDGNHIEDTDGNLIEPDI